MITVEILRCLIMRKSVDSLVQRCIVCNRCECLKSKQRESNNDCQSDCSISCALWFQDVGSVVYVTIFTPVLTGSLLPLYSALVLQVSTPLSLLPQNKVKVAPVLLLYLCLTIFNPHSLVCAGIM